MNWLAAEGVTGASELEAGRSRSEVVDDWSEQIKEDLDGEVQRIREQGNNGPRPTDSEADASRESWLKQTAMDIVEGTVVRRQVLRDIKSAYRDAVKPLKRSSSTSEFLSCA
jgi:hypothetical protein